MLASEGRPLHARGLGIGRWAFRVTSFADASTTRRGGFAFASVNSGIPL